MKRTFLVLGLVLSFALMSAAQNSPAPSSNGPATEAQPAGSPDVSAVGGGDKSGNKSLVGCLSGPNASGQYTLQTGKEGKTVEVSGSDDLKAHVGHKVKLTGTWEKAEAAAASSGSEKSEHQHGEKHLKVTSIEHVADKCDMSGAAAEAPKEKY